MLAVKADDIDVTVGCSGHFLSLAEGENCTMQIAIFCREFVLAIFGKMPHSLFERFRKLFILTVKQNLNVSSRFLIFLLGTKPFHARAEAAF